MAEVIIVIICLSLNALLAAYEMAFVCIPRSEALRIAEEIVLK